MPFQLFILDVYQMFSNLLAKVFEAIKREETDYLTRWNNEVVVEWQEINDLPFSFKLCSQCNSSCIQKLLILSPGPLQSIITVLNRH